MYQYALEVPPHESPDAVCLEPLVPYCLPTRVPPYPRWDPVSGPYSLLQRGELFLETSHCIEVQKGPPAHAGDSQCGQLRQRRSLR